VDDQRGPGEPTLELAPTDLPAGADSGLLLHDVLENADLARARSAPSAEAWRADPDVDAQLRAHARERGIAEIYLPHAARLAYTTLVEPLVLVDGRELPPLVAATALAREVEFAYPIPRPPAGDDDDASPRGLVKGFIDALVAWDDELWVLDYKSDLLDTANLASAARDRVRSSYAVQAQLYAIAAQRLAGSRRLAGMLFAFVRHGVVVPVPITESMLDTTMRWLAALRPEAPR
jgi:ATP-dependent exoDNAse (exonuclease V) beta subunit